MLRDISQLVRNCPTCQVKKHSNEKKFPMKITDTAGITFERVFMDLVGPLPQSHAGNRYILTVQDDLSKFLGAFPLVDKSANTVARAMVKHFFMKYAFPKFLISDCGSEFLAKVQQSVCGLLKIEQITSAPYHHQTVGALENSHKVLGNYLRSFSEEDKYNWDLWIPYFSYCYNSTVHFATGYTPFELVLGRNNPIPDGKLRPLEPCYDVDDYVNELRTRLEQARKDARDAQIQQKEKRKIFYDSKYKTLDKKIGIGDFALIRKENRDKLDSIWHGPYEVIEIDESNCYVHCHLV